MTAVGAPNDLGDHRVTALDEDAFALKQSLKSRTCSKVGLDLVMLEMLSQSCVHNHAFPMIRSWSCIHSHAYRITHSQSCI